MTPHEEFYVGYQDRAPRRVARFLAARVGLLLAGAAGLAAVLAALQRVPEPAVFEFGVVRVFEGVVREDPYPMLLVGEASGSPATGYLLVGEGKRGAHDLTAGLDGARVRVEGTLIYRETHTMVELHGAPEVLGTTTTDQPTETTVAGPALTLGGEVVDGKCHLGAMNPGSGPTHRGCAIRCLLGGTPPLFVPEDGGVKGPPHLLVDTDGRALDPRRLQWVGEQVRITGRVRRSAEWMVLELDPASIIRSGS